MFYRCSIGVRSVFGRCVVGVWSVLGRCFRAKGISSTRQSSMPARTSGSTSTDGSVATTALSALTASEETRVLVSRVRASSKRRLAPTCLTSGRSCGGAANARGVGRKRRRSRPQNQVGVGRKSKGCRPQKQGRSAASRTEPGSSPPSAINPPAAQEGGGACCQAQNAADIHRGKASRPANPQE